MDLILRSIRFFLKKGDHNILKIFTLAIGLSASLVLLAKVTFDNSFDSFFPDKESIYRVHSLIGSVHDELYKYSSTPGAIAVFAQLEVPQVESSTRFTDTDQPSYQFWTEDKNIHEAGFTLVDSSFFSVFNRRIIEGDPTEILSIPMQIMITDKMAELLGGNPVGQTIEICDMDSMIFTIAGIYEAIPDNSHLDLDILISMPSIRNLMWDGSMNWHGNDRYRSYVKLTPNSTVEQAEQGINAMLAKHVDLDNLRAKGEYISYGLEPMTELHSGNDSVKIMNRMLMALSFVILFAAVMNYMLVVISSIVTRAKEIALHKCYGASTGKIYRMMLSESFVHIFLALFLATLFIDSFGGVIERLMGISIGSMFHISYAWPLIVVCLFVWLFSGILPGALFSHIPILTVFRIYSDNKRKWKMSLLFVQFVVSAFLISFLLLVSKQYNFMMSDNVGYNYENVIYTQLSNVDQRTRNMCADEISKMPEVTQVSSCSELPFEGLSGNNVIIENETLFNIGDFWWTGDNYVDFMQIPILAGSSFRSKNGTEVMVSRRFVEKMNAAGKWSDGAVGEAIRVTSYRQTLTVCGVYEDFRVGSLVSEDRRPTAMFNNGSHPDYLLVRLKNETPEAIQKVDAKLKELLPERDIALTLKGWRQSLESEYSDWLNFRDSVLMGAIVALVISLLGLVGYLNNEIGRRGKEIALRKIHGASRRSIVGLFIAQISVLSAVAFLIGTGSAIIIGAKWQEQFVQKAPIDWYLYVGCIVGLAILVCSIITLNCLRIASRNPVENLKSE